MGKSRRQHGEGSVHKRGDGRWVAVAELPRKAGRRNRRTFYGSTPDEAMGKRDAFLTAYRAGFEKPKGRPQTTAEWMWYWLENICQAGPSSVVTYRRSITCHILPALGAIPLSALDDTAIEGLYRTMRRKGLSVSTVRKVHAVLRQALDAAERRHRIPRNPCQHVKPGKRPRAGTAGAPEQPEVARVLHALGGRRNPARWLVALVLGLRQGEALGLLWPGIDLGVGELTVGWQLRRLPLEHGCGNPGVCAAAHCRAACPPGCKRKDHVLRGHPKPCRPGCTRHAFACPQRTGGLMLAEPKTPGSADVLPVPAVLADALRRHAIEQKKERLAAGPGWTGWQHDCSRRLRPKEIVCPGCGKPADPFALVFTTESGGPIDHRADWHEWSALCEDAGLPHYRPHDLRHFTATFHLELGTDISVVQAIMRHANVTQTQGYQHVRRRLVSEALDRASESPLWRGFTGPVQG